MSRCLVQSLEGSSFVFDHVNGLHYKSHKIHFRRGGSYLNSPEWVKNKILFNPKNDNDDNCFRYAVTVALSHE